MVEARLDSLTAIADFTELSDWVVVHSVELEPNYEFSVLGSPLEQIDWVTVANTHELVLAQQFEQTLGQDVAAWFENFVESGQVWALVIGFILGYLFKGLTSFG